MSETIRIMTSNLLHGGADVGAFGDVLDRVEPDVVVTQELAPVYVDVLTDRFPHHSLHPSHDFTGRGIATHLDVEFGVIPMPVRFGTTAQLRVGGETWNLAGVHLLNPIDFPWWTSVKRRSGQLSAIEQWADGLDGPVVIAGDFNASPRWPAYRHMVERWSDLVADHASASGTRADRTWAWRPGWPRLLRIDHVFGSGLFATATSVVPIEGSDHAAVYVDVTLGNRGR